MIFTDKKITDKVLLIRAYFWSDPYKGWGDGGTKGYFKVPLKDFKGKKEKRAEGIGGFYYTYKLKNEEAIELLGEHYWMKCSYELADKNKMEDEKRLANSILELHKNIT